MKSIDRFIYKYLNELLILSVSVVVAQSYYLNIFRRFSEPASNLHYQIIAGVAESPYRYRILIPYITEMLNRFMPLEVAYMTYFLISISLFLLTLYYWIKSYTKTQTSLLVTILFAALLPIYLKDHFFQPWTLFESLVFVVSLFLIKYDKVILLGFVIIIATLNRETGIFIVSLYGLNQFDKIMNKELNREKLFFVFFTFLWITTYGSLRFFLGSSNHITPILDILIFNLSNRSIFLTIFNWTFSLGILWYFFLSGLSYNDRFLSKIKYLIPIYLIVILVFGVWYEVRLLIPIMPIFLVIIAIKYEEYSDSK